MLGRLGTCRRQLHGNLPLQDGRTLVQQPELQLTLHHF